MSNSHRKLRNLVPMKHLRLVSTLDRSVVGVYCPVNKWLIYGTYYVCCNSMTTFREMEHVEYPFIDDVKKDYEIVGVYEIKMLFTDASEVELVEKKR